MSTADCPSSLPVSIVFHTDWGVSTGTGLAGGVDSVVETDERRLPVVRGTVLAGVIREQSGIVAQALDAGDTGPWHDFIADLFGSATSPRLVSFTDARMSEDVDPEEAIHEVVSLKINEETGTAQEDFLRVFERAGACTLTGTAQFLQADPSGRPVAWDEAQHAAATLVLAVSGLLVRGVGSDRSDGDGRCEIVVKPAGAAENAAAVRAWCREQLENLACQAPVSPRAAAPQAGPVVGGRQDRRPTAVHEAPLDIRLMTPVVSYEVPLSNEIRSLDFVRGTALLPLVHRRLRAAFPDDDLVRDAVVAGDLFVSDATAVVGDRPGLPAPLVLSRPKAPSHEGEPHARPAPEEGRAVVQAANRLLVGEPGDVHVPLRSGFVFPDLDLAGLSDDHCGLGAPALTGRQSTAHDPATGAAGRGELFLVKALPAHLRMRATVTMSDRLYERVRGRIDEVLPPDETRRDHLGSRRLSGSFGRVACHLGAFRPASAPTPQWDEEGATTVWLLSDVVARSPELGPGGRVEDLLAAFEAAGAPVRLVDVPGRFSAGLRHRRVDSWSAADGQPRATRMAIRAGSVLRVRPRGGEDAEAVMTALAELSLTGVGELTAQGFGRFAVGHELLGRRRIPLAGLTREDFLGEGDRAKAAARDQEER